jgi:hypothetical protein
MLHLSLKEEKTAHITSSVPGIVKNQHEFISCISKYAFSETSLHLFSVCLNWLNSIYMAVFESTQPISHTKSPTCGKQKTR